MKKSILVELIKLNSYLRDFIYTSLNLLHYMQEFKVNEYITLKLENERTVIYVKGALFRQCKFLLMNIPVGKIGTFSEIESIDEAAEILDSSLERVQDGQDVKISLETEFWGHCSNLQAWVENQYDTRILHRTIAFPLLRKLSDVGDKNARKVFKDEIAKRFASGNENIILYLLEQNYLNYLNEEEKETLFEEFKVEKLSRIKPRNFLPILEQLAKLEIDSALTLLKDEISTRIINGNFHEIIGITPHFNTHYFDYLEDNELAHALKNINLTLNLKNESFAKKDNLNLTVTILDKRNPKIKDLVKKRFVSVWKYQEISIYSLNFLVSLLEIELINKNEVCDLIYEIFDDFINFILNINKKYNSLNSKSNRIFFSALIVIFENLDHEYVKKIYHASNNKIRARIVSILSSNILNYSFSIQKKGPNFQHLEILSRLKSKIFVIDGLHTLLKFTGFPLFEELINKLEKVKFFVPEELVKNIGSLVILLQEKIQLYSPEVISYESKYYIMELFYEYELIFQQIVQGYYSTTISDLIQQITYYFELILMLNEIIYNEIDKISKSIFVRSLLKNRRYFPLKKSGHFNYGSLWKQKQIILYDKLFLKPWPEMPQLRWLEKEKWEHYISNRDQNLDEDLDFYKSNRKKFNNLVEFIVVEIFEQELTIEIKRLTSGFQHFDTALEIKMIELNSKSPNFKTNEKNIIVGLGLKKNYYREVAYQLLLTLKSNNLVVKKELLLDKLTNEEKVSLKKHLIHAMLQDSFEERVLAAKDLGFLDKSFKDKNFYQIIWELDKENQNNILKKLINEFRDYSDSKKKEFDQVLQFVEFLITLNSPYSNKILKANRKYFENLEINNLIDRYLKATPMEKKNISNQIKNDSVNIWLEFSSKFGDDKLYKHITGPPPTLNLRRKNLATLPDTIGNYKNLETIFLDINELTSLPESIVNLINLKKLVLSHNKLKIIPSSFGTLKILKFLFLDDNKLSEIPDSISKISTLRLLNLNSNEFKSFPISICKLKNLHKLQISRNKIELLPSEIGNLNSLEILTLNNNNLETLPDSIVNLKSLKIIEIRKNPISSENHILGALKRMGVKVIL